MNEPPPHIEKRAGKPGEYWAFPRQLEEQKLSKEVYLFAPESGGWVQVIEPRARVTDWARQHVQLSSRPVKNGEPLFRLVNLNQLWYDRATDCVVQVTPYLWARELHRADYMRAALAVARQVASSSSGDVIAHFGEELEKLDKGFYDYIDSHNIILDGDKLTSSMYRLMEVRHAYSAAMGPGIEEVLPTLPKPMQQALGIYENYLGNGQRPLFEFGRDAAIPAGVATTFSQTRYFTHADALPSVLNVLLPQAVFRETDIYRRGVAGDTVYERVGQYVVLEITAKPEHFESGKLEATNYSECLGLMRYMCGKLDGLVASTDRCRLAPTVKPDARRLEFLLQALAVWSNIYSEVRVNGCFIPRRVYGVRPSFVTSCGDRDFFDPCEVCSRFDIGECIWDAEDRKDYRRWWSERQFNGRTFRGDFDPGKQPITQFD
jgi:hypothetical protein